MCKRLLAFALLALVLPLSAATEVHQLEAILSPSNENPAVSDRAAIGEARIGIRVERGMTGNITDAIVDFDLEVYLGQAEELIALHIHRAAAGANGPIVVSSGGLDFGTPSVVAEMGDVRIYRQRLAEMDAAVLGAIEEILANPSGFYVNLHSTAKRGGLVRGQLQRTDAALISAGTKETLANRDAVTALNSLVSTMRLTLDSIARRLGLVPAK